MSAAAAERPALMATVIDQLACLQLLGVMLAQLPDTLRPWPVSWRVSDVIGREIQGVVTSWNDTIPDQTRVQIMEEWAKFLNGTMRRASSEDQHFLIVTATGEPADQAPVKVWITTQLIEGLPDTQET